MPLTLPPPIAAYFSADNADGDSVVACFTDDAVVKDEGHTHRGMTAIGKWKADSASKYSYTSEPIAAEQQDGKTVVTSRVSGNFPGSPIDLRYAFGIEGSKIASLEIGV